MKKIRIGLTSLALVLGVVSVFATKSNAISTTYTDGNGNQLDPTFVAQTCTSTQNFCANEYQDGAFVQQLNKP